jgi:transketolase
MKKYNTMRGWFAYELYEAMKKDKKIWLIVGDLGYGMFDKIKEDFPTRFVNVGAAEQAMVGVATGLALQGQIPLCYSITPFLLYRPFETIRNYINREEIPVKLIAAGRDKDYLDDGFSHWAEEDLNIIEMFKNIQGYWPKEKEEIPPLLKEIITNNKPCYVNLRR